jgi:NADH-quinone oxidoreductase subunit A
VSPQHTTYDLDAAAERVRDTRYPGAEEFAARSILDPPAEAAMLEALGAAQIGRSDRPDGLPPRSADHSRVGLVRPCGGAYPPILMSTPVLATLDLNAYLPIGLLVVMAIVFAAFSLVATHALGPRAVGAEKVSVYESGMNPFGSARKRFNVRFYILAMTFLVFDVEIIFLYPWAVTYTKLPAGSPEAGLFLGRVLFFILTSIIAYVYAWRKGVFRWD